MIPASDEFIVKWSQGNGRNVRWRDLTSFLGRYPDHFSGDRRGIKLMVGVRGAHQYAFTFKFEDPAPDKHMPYTYVNRFVRLLYREGMIEDE